jgi:hypothetical protein
MAETSTPMIRLEPGGEAPILSYNVPEPTSYSGRNFIALDFPATYFKQKTSLGTAASPATSTPAITPSILSLGLPGILAAATSSPPSTEELSPELANLEPAEVRAMMQAGKELNIYRSMYGTLTYNYIDTNATVGPLLPAGPSMVDAPNPNPEPIPVALSRIIDEADWGDGEDGGDGDVPDYLVTIYEPKDNETIRGPHTGAPISAAGIARPSGAPIHVEIGSQISGETYPLPPYDNLDNGAWSFGAYVTESGPILIKANNSGDPRNEAVRSINVVLDPPPDTTPAALSIDSITVRPDGGSSLNGFPVDVAGKASDPSGVREVRVAADDKNALQSPGAGAIPKAPSDWSGWTKTLLLKPGDHTIFAECTDNANNVSSVNKSVTVEPPAGGGGTGASPPPPVIAITSPDDNAPLTGPFGGVKVPVTGTLTGTAPAVSRVQQIEVTVVDESPPATALATPKAPNDWSEWTTPANKPLEIRTPGRHVITATCKDNSNNVLNEHSIAVDVTLIPKLESGLPKLIIVESYRLSSYLGTYGAGRTLKTFSLLPGEKTKISVKSYTRSEENAKSASSILDSFTEKSSNDFEKSMGKEQTDKQGHDESFKYKVAAEAQASWGFASAKISGEVSGGSNASREEFAKNISNATEKHAATASAKRDVQIDTSNEIKEETGFETAIERELENINVGRTLNFVFRQMNQEFITILHLVDVRIGYFREDEVNDVPQSTYREVTLPQLDTLLQEVLVEDNSTRKEVRDAILHQLTNIFDYKDMHHSFVEEKPLKDGSGNEVPNSGYLRAKKDYTSTYLDEATGTKKMVPGIILAANKYVMRTEGIIVEALLGAGNGLDPYSQGLQEQAVKDKLVRNTQAEMDVERQNLARKIVAEGDDEAADRFAKVFSKSAAESIDLDLSVNGQRPGSGIPTPPDG